MKFPSQCRIFLSPGATDLRKSIQGLSLFVESQLQLDLFSGSMFCFCNRTRKIIKLLYWDHNGFCLWMKRLEKDRFQWPETSMQSMRMTQKELFWLLDGLSIYQNKAHQKLEYSSLG